ncbi:MAG: hypothetical protein Q4D93_06025 [Porphyromonas sp.]|nr:hypothetical protein [Porphyromonas sp.]
MIDTDLPALHEGVLPIGVTLDMGDEGKDLLSPNLLVNGSFDLAPRLRDGAFDYARKTVSTPNKYTTYYPLPLYLHGWEVMVGDIALDLRSDSISTRPSNTLRFRVSPRDSISSIRHTGFPLSITAGDELSFRCRFRSTEGVELKISLVNDSLELVSTIATIGHGSLDWAKTEVTLTTFSSVENASLLLTAQLRSSTSPSYYQDDEGNWHSISHFIWLDDCHLAPEHSEMQDGISAELHSFLSELNPDFLRFPGGRTINGFYPGTYPLHLDSLEWTPIWTLPGAEYTGDFDYHHFVALAKSLDAIPVLLVNFGFTDPTAKQRIEGLKLLEERSHYLAELYRSAADERLVLQPGYDLAGPEYNLRFKHMLQYIKKDSVAPEFITGGALTPETPYSDYTTDLVIPPVQRPDLSTVLPPPDSVFYLTEPLMLGEVHFDEVEGDEYNLSPLLQRVCFLIEAEHYSGALQGLTLSPLLASPHSSQLPLIRYHAARYEPTLLYDYLLYYQEWRGDQLRALSITPEEHPLYLSLTSDKEGNNYYLKVANTARHPLPYQISFKGFYANFSSYKTISYTPEVSTFKVGEEQKISSRALHYTFNPHEIVIFHFRQNKK